ncbi:MAG TPA: hypothetical protein VH393_04340 [Ktedonobacterales bacterium]|jgi:hypothetical protein
MYYKPPPSWTARILLTLFLLLLAAVALRVVYELLQPALPIALALLILVALFRMVFRGRR